jgi:hypothetical protein
VPQPYNPIQLDIEKYRRNVRIWEGRKAGRPEGAASLRSANKWLLRRRQYPSHLSGQVGVRPTGRGQARERARDPTGATGLVRVKQ